MFDADDTVLGHLINHCHALAKQFPGIRVWSELRRSERGNDYPVFETNTSYEQNPDAWRALTEVVNQASHFLPEIGLRLDDMPGNRLSDRWVSFLFYNSHAEETGEWVNAPVGSTNDYEITEMTVCPFIASANALNAIRLHKMQRNLKMTDDQRKAWQRTQIVEYINSGQTLTEAAKSVGVARSTAYTWPEAVAAYERKVPIGVGGKPAAPRGRRGKGRVTKVVRKPKDIKPRGL
jgi:hypothetical protein